MGNCCGNKNVQGKMDANRRKPMNPNQNQGQGDDALPERAPVDYQDKKVYENPAQIVQLALTNDTEFINLMKSFKGKDFKRYVGLEKANEPIILKSGRVMNTIANWNPLTVGLVMDKQNLVKFICEEINFDIKRLLEIQVSDDYLSLQDNGEISYEHRSQQGMLQTLLLAAENNSSQIKYLLNELGHHISSEAMRMFIAQASKLEDGPEIIKTVLESQSFKSLYYELVQNTGLQKHKNSFSPFFEKYLASACSETKVRPVLTKSLCKAPYNVAFAIYLLSDYTRAKQDHQMESIEQLVHDCRVQIHDFDVYRVCQTLTSDHIEDLAKICIDLPPNMQKEVTQFKNVLVKKHDQIPTTFLPNIKKLQEIIKKGDFKGFKNKIGKIFPKEALFLITGYEIPDYKVNIVSALRFVQIETRDMNVLELAMCLGKQDIVNYCIDTLNLKQSRDFQQFRVRTNFSAQLFAYVPLIQNNQGILSKILELPYLWSIDEFKDMVLLIKQTKWTQGIKIALQSKTAHVLFSRLALQEQFRYIRDMLVLPYLIQPDDAADDNDSSILEELENNDNGGALSSRKGATLAESDQQDIAKVVIDIMSSQPYACSALLQNFAQRRGTYKNEIGPAQLPDETLRQKIFFANKANSAIQCTDLADFINETRGGLSKVVEQALNVFNDQARMSNVDPKEIQAYHIEINFLLQRILTHPIHLQYQEQQQQQEPVNAQQQ